MNIKSFRLDLPYVFRKRMQSNVSLRTIFETLKPGSDRERNESIIEDILRWADDGGQMLDIRQLISKLNPEAVQERQKE